MKLAIFDLDNTLIAGDSDALWGEFITEHGYIDGDAYAKQHDQFYEDYVQGTLDIDEFLRFQLKLLGEHDANTLHTWREAYMQEKIAPLILDKAKDKIAEHKEAGHTLLIITATNEFLTQPIADELGIQHLIACGVEIIDNEYTGNTVGVPSFAEGKITRLHQWLEQTQQTISESWFYSDSRNDIPLLSEVHHPVAVDADEVLTNHAQQQGWDIISFR